MVSGWLARPAPVNRSNAIRPAPAARPAGGSADAVEGRGEGWLALGATAREARQDAQRRALRSFRWEGLSSFPTDDCRFSYGPEVQVLLFPLDSKYSIFKTLHVFPLELNIRFHHERIMVSWTVGVIVERGTG